MPLSSSARLLPDGSGSDWGFLKSVLIIRFKGRNFREYNTDLPGYSIISFFLWGISVQLFLRGDDAVNVFSVDEGNETVMNMTSFVDI